jgi:DNA (cytosine-5)-methyltransferase 1
MYGLDLFSGIGGITKALEGYVTPVAYCENDRYAQGVLLSRMATGDLPLAPIWDDVTTLRGTYIPSVDIIYGGFPCQDISVAGRMEGIGGKRSGLFSEIVRLAKEIRPAFLFLENVPNIRTRGLRHVVRELSESGYDLRWDTLSAQDVGANHRRQRWFLLAYSHDEGLQGRVSGELQKCPGERTARTSSAPVADAQGVGLEISENAGGKSKRTGSVSRLSVKPPSSDWWLIEPDVGRVAHGVQNRVDRLRALGNSVVPAQAREAFERLIGRSL